MNYTILERYTISSKQLHSLFNAHELIPIQILPYRTTDKVTDLLIEAICSIKPTDSIKETDFFNQLNSINEVDSSQNKLIFRISNQPLVEADKLTLVEEVSLSTKLCFVGELTLSDLTQLYYVCFNYIEGEALFDVIPALTDSEASHLGQELAKFIVELHQRKAETYDVGHYIPFLSKFQGSWRSGHEAYLEIIISALNNMHLDTEESKLIQKSIDQIREKLPALDYQSGPVLLHNDLHPKNIILNRGAISGVIDWECAQYGESDFELLHMIHWMLFDLNDFTQFKTLVQSLLITYQKLNPIPLLENRLTIYLLEHELIQLTWHPEQKKERFKRIDTLLKFSLCLTPK